MKLSDVQSDCRHFSGYKPCSLNSTCTSACPKKEVAHPRILIVHLEALGAVLRATAILPAIKKRWPRAHLTWITGSLAAPLLENNPHIDRLLKNDHQGFVTLSALSFDYSFCVDKSILAAGLLGTPKQSGECRGFGIDSRSGAVVPLNIEAEDLYKLGLSNHEKFFVNRKSEIRLITESLGLEYDRDPYVFEFTSSEVEFSKLERQRLLGGEPRPVIGLNTGCSGVIQYKKLSLEAWLRQIDALTVLMPDARLMLLGGPEDTERNLTLASRSPVPLIQTPTETGLRRGMTYVDLCDAVVTGDSLGMHMAIALKKWVVAWFGPTCAHEIDFYNFGHAVITQAACSPCWKRHCEKSVMCYDQVNHYDVAREIKNGLAVVKRRQRQIETSAENSRAAGSASRSQDGEISND